MAFTPSPPRRGVITRAALRLVNDVLVATIEVTTPEGTYPCQEIALDNWRPERGRRVGTSYGADVLRQLLVTVGVPRWDALIGAKVRFYLGSTATYVAELLHDTDEGRPSWDPVALAGIH